MITITMPRLVVNVDKRFLDTWEKQLFYLLLYTYSFLIKKRNGKKERKREKGCFIILRVAGLILCVLCVNVQCGLFVPHVAALVAGS